MNEEKKKENYYSMKKTANMPTQNYYYRKKEIAILPTKLN